MVNGRWEIESMRNWNAERMMNAYPRLAELPELIIENDRVYINLSQFSFTKWVEFIADITEEYSYKELLINFRDKNITIHDDYLY